MSFQATDFEFRNRFWLISAIFGLAFACNFFDHNNFGVALTRTILHWGHGRSVLNEDASPFSNALRVIFLCGTFLLVLAALVRSWATSYLKSSVVHDAALHSELLVADGPYRHLRNPLYLGNILQAVGIGFLASTVGFPVLVVGLTLFMIRLIRREEAGLLLSQGESYRRYLAAVPQLLPSIRALVPGSGATPNWRDGILAELFFWIFAAGMAVFTLTLQASHFLIALGIGFALYFLQSFLRRGKIR